MQEILDPTSSPVWLLSTPCGWENTTDWPRSCLTSTHTGTMRGFTRRPGKSTSQRCSTSPTMNGKWLKRFRLLRLTVFLRMEDFWKSTNFIQDAHKPIWVLTSIRGCFTLFCRLPIVLGTDYASQLDILPETYGHSDRYDPEVNPTITNVFATAAFRY